MKFRKLLHVREILAHRAEGNAHGTNADTLDQDDDEAPGEADASDSFGECSHSYGFRASMSPSSVVTTERNRSRGRSGSDRNSGKQAHTGSREEIETCDRGAVDGEVGGKVGGRH